MAINILSKSEWLKCYKVTIKDRMVFDSGLEPTEDELQAELDFQYEAYAYEAGEVQSGQHYDQDSFV